MKNIRAMIVMAVLGIATAPLAFGEAYVEANFGKPVATLLWNNDRYNFMGDFGWNLNSGFKFNRFLGIEGGFTQFPITAVIAIFTIW